VLRVREGLLALPTPLRSAAAEIVRQNVPGDAALSVLRKASDANELLRRLRADRRLMTADGRQLEGSFTRYQQLDTTKKHLTRQAIGHHWASKQKDQLLAGIGSRLNGQGADLRRRLTIRGERAMRLRQVIHVGQGIEGGDPLFNLRPVWMASPETVAQIFPRSALFDVVIFDEASQCRLEEAMPVLLRASRVVIAGDPKQLPPTRFFESAVAAGRNRGPPRGRAESLDRGMLSRRPLPFAQFRSDRILQRQVLSFPPPGHPRPSAKPHPLRPAHAVSLHRHV
jgi:hypothetical protein